MEKLYYEIVGLLKAIEKVESIEDFGELAKTLKWKWDLYRMLTDSIVCSIRMGWVTCNLGGEDWLKWALKEQHTRYM